MFFLRACQVLYLLLQVFPLTSLVAVLLQQRKNVKDKAEDLSDMPVKECAIEEGENNAET